MKNDLTQEMLKELLHYNPDTGIFTWTDKVRNKNRKGAIAGTTTSEGYRQIAIDRKSYRVNRLAFLFMEGYLPENCVDHINRVRNDDRWCNLREVSHQCNMRNKNTSYSNNSGVVGVHIENSVNKWKVTIGNGNKEMFIGRFVEFKEAVKARWEAEIKYKYPNCNTTSSAYLYLKENAPELLAS